MVIDGSGTTDYLMNKDNSSPSPAKAVPPLISPISWSGSRFSHEAAAPCPNAKLPSYKPTS